jgi:hypothetical protein
LRKFFAAHLEPHCFQFVICSYHSITFCSRVNLPSMIFSLLIFQIFSVSPRLRGGFWSFGCGSATLCPLWLVLVAALPRLRLCGELLALVSFVFLRVTLWLIFVLAVKQAFVRWTRWQVF